MSNVAPATQVYGLLAEFPDQHALTEAAHKTWEAGYRRVDAFSPYPIEELSEVLHMGRSKLPRAVLAGGILGGLSGYSLCYWISVISFPINVGGRPLHSWPAFIVPSFETTILGAALGAVLGMMALNRLPEPYHPLFNVEAFGEATTNRFFLCIEAVDSRFDSNATRAFLAGLGATAVTEVPL
jgi:hypothetical protein